MIELFQKGGPIMWPLLITSIVSLSVVFERLYFILRIKISQNRSDVQRILTAVEQNKTTELSQEIQNTDDFVARTLLFGLAHKDTSIAHALMQQASIELSRFNRGLSILDTVITLAPLLGLLGTVTGMISSFNLLGAQELGVPTQITGGIAEALIATAFGLGVAITSLIPFNYLNNFLEEARRELQEASTHIELLIMKGR